MRSIVLLIAVNKASWHNGKQALQTLKYGFETLFTILTKIQDGKGAPCLIEIKTDTSYVKAAGVQVKE